MSNSTWSGPVRSKAGFKHVNVSAGVETEVEIVDSSGNLSAATFLTDAATAEHGAGFIGTGPAPQLRRWTENGVIITQLKFDITGLYVLGTAAD